METISCNTKYFVTPSNNIVRGVIEGGKLVGAEMFINKKNEYSTPTQLNQLVKERSNLTQGKVELKEIKRPNYSDYNIPIDAGRKPRKNVVGGQVDIEVEAGAGKGKGNRRKPKNLYGGDATSLGETIEDIEAGKGGKGGKRKGKGGKGADKISGGTVEFEDIEAGKKRRKSVASKASKASKGSKKSKKSGRKSKKSDSLILGGAPLVDEKKTTLADLFKQVSLHLANQTSELIAQGGNPTEMLKDDIKFFSK
jgi:hypothetical protein